jgi:hypothetical protein
VEFAPSADCDGALMRLRSRIALALVMLLAAAGIGLGVAGIPKSTPLDPVLDPVGITTTTAPRTPITAPPTTAQPSSTTSTTSTSTPIGQQSDGDTEEAEEADGPMIQILNAGAGPGGAAAAAQSLDLSMISELRLADAPRPQEQSQILYRPEATSLLAQMLRANPLLEDLPRLQVAIWPTWADPAAVIVVLVTPDWPSP